jgi:hypothetical protein
VVVFEFGSAGYGSVGKDGLESRDQESVPFFNLKLDPPET